MRALADPTRLRITMLIRQLELSVGEVVQILGQSQPRVSRHIRILDEAGIADRHKEGSWVFLRPGPAILCGQLEPLLAASDMADNRRAQRDLEKLGEVRAARAEMAADYFARHASEWDSLRSLHVAEAEVEQAMADILATSPIGRALDIGTGTGRMIELFARQAESFAAIDNSAEMLRLARAKIASINLPKAQMERLDIRLGDFNQLPLEDEAFDTVLLHQVLHYAQAPERAIAEASRVLAPGGRLMIVDFASHDREELRTVHAHSRLGFSDESIERALGLVGLRLTHQKTLASGTLNVKIWLGEKSSEGNVAPSPNPATNMTSRLRIVT
jgi:ubiquinone/menaquinone biosynthesis C-methylase UbiE